jgi:hypothetical protein
MSPEMRANGNRLDSFGSDEVISKRIETSRRLCKQYPVQIIWEQLAAWQFGFLLCSKTALLQPVNNAR